MYRCHVPQLFGRQQQLPVASCPAAVVKPCKRSAPSQGCKSHHQQQPPTRFPSFITTSHLVSSHRRAKLLSYKTPPRLPHAAKLALFPTLPSSTLNTAFSTALALSTHTHTPIHTTVDEWARLHRSPVHLRMSNYVAALLGCLLHCLGQRPITELKCHPQDQSKSVMAVNLGKPGGLPTVSARTPLLFRSLSPPQSCSGPNACLPAWLTAFLAH